MKWLDRLLGRRPKTPVLLSVKLPEANPEEPVTLYGDQPMRKAWAEDVLRAEGVPINPHLPVIESISETTLRTPREVADRLLALTLIAAKGEGLDQPTFMEVVAERNAAPLMTPRECAFADKPEPSMHERVQFSWRYEAAWVLLWALQLVDGMLGPPRQTCDPAELARIVRDTPDLAAHGLRSVNDVLVEADLIYRYHWAVRQAGIEGRKPPAKLDEGVVMERHHALNWLIGYDDRADWDDVSTDT